MTAAPRAWTVLASEVAFADPWLRVRSDQCRIGRGDVVGPYHVIEYPDWVTVVPLTATGRLLLLREYRHGVGAVLTGLPGGLVDPGDGSPETAARRELLEETGHGGGTLTPLGAVHPNPSNQTNTAFSFLATNLVRTAPIRPDGGGEDPVLVHGDLAEVLAGLRDGVLRMHAVHAAALWCAAARIAAARTGLYGTLTPQLADFLSGTRPMPSGTSGLLTVGG